MSERIEHPIDPAEFARLMSLPEDHPDRRRVEQGAEFAALRTLYRAFVEVAVQAPTGESSAEAGAEVFRRASARLDAASRSSTRRPAGSAPSRLEALIAWFARPASRIGFAFAILLAVAAVGGWWRMRPPASERMRGENDASFRMTAITLAPGDVEVSWTPVAEADTYRVVFVDAGLAEVGRLDVGATTHATVPPDSLKAWSLARRVSLEVEALRNGEIVATTGFQPLRVR